MNKLEKKIVYGDFQTPRDLADTMCDILLEKNISPKTIVEPNCGIGNIFLSSIQHFKHCNHFIGLDINERYLNILSSRIKNINNHKSIILEQKDFFDLELNKFFENYDEPLMFIGNPPWVTNSVLGTLDHNNLPEKNNFQNHKGIDAITGKSNFDISEWMLLKLLNFIANKNSIFAMLCKTSVARKILLYAWEKDIRLKEASIYNFDAKKYFNVNVDACLFYFQSSTFYPKDKSCKIYDKLFSKAPGKKIGFYDNRLIFDVNSYLKFHQLKGNSPYTWRNGIKHDSAKVMELTYDDRYYINGFGEKYQLEDTYIYPLLKSSDVAKGNNINPRKYVIVTQKAVGQETRIIEYYSPLTWKYLIEHKDILNDRKSSIYKNKPMFSVFSVGDYTFSPWKIAISSLYKKLYFSLVKPINGKPVMVDDTCNFIPCYSENEAFLLHELLNSKEAIEFYSSIIFWDAKRPITIDILKQLNLREVAKLLNKLDEFEEYVSDNITIEDEPKEMTLPLIF